VHATHSMDQIRKFFSASLKAILRDATREFIYETVSLIFFRFDGESYQSAGSSAYHHLFTNGLANYRKKALTTGCYGNPKCGVKTELMDMNTLTWSIGPDYPLTSE